MEFLHGSVFKITREDTLADIENNFVQMKDAGLDTAVIWPSSFWWEEKKEGYPFNTGRELLKLAQKHEIKIIMELAGQLSTLEYIPDFLMKEEYYATDEDGNIIWGQPSFGFLNYFHPEVNKLICDHFAKTAEAYKDYPALIAYDIFNETFFRSFDEYTMEEFRKWLKEKYGSIEKLNKVWERTYSDFSQVDYQCWKWLSIMPEADYAAFRKAAIPRFLKNWCEAVRKVDNKHYLIADNIASMICKGDYDRPQDDFSLKEVVDEIGMSFYPKGVDGCYLPDKRWCIFDGLYAASKREGYLISEMQTHTQALFNPMTAVRPYELKQWSLESISSGAKALIYWMWRPFTKGLQTLGRGLVDYKNRSTPRLEVARELSDIISDIGVVKPITSKVAILYDDKCEDFQRMYTKAYNVEQEIYLSSIQGAYCALFDNNIHADLIKINEIENYKAVILTNHIIIDKETADKLKSFVNNGGALICDGKIGIVDYESMLNKELPGGEFNECMGFEFIDTDYEELEFTYKGVKVKGYYGKDITENKDTESLAKFIDGTDAVYEKSVGMGKVVSINTHLWYGYEKTKDESVKKFAELLFNEFKDFEITQPLKARFCENEKDYVAFVFNYTNEDAKGHIKNGAFDEDVLVKANDVLILKKEK